MSSDPLDNSSTLRNFAPGSIVFGRHELTERIAIGRHGEVWKARDPKLADMQVALKLMPASPRYKELAASIRSITDLSHPNIVRTYALMGDEDLGGFVMEQVKGRPLSLLLTGKEPPFFELSEVRAWAVQLFTALQFAWDHGRVVHGDLRPANLFITTGGSLKVAEFCFAPLRWNRPVNEEELTSGARSLSCLSPQVICGENPAHADDLYAAAACLYEALTGKPVFMSGNIVAQVQRKVPPSVAERRAELGLKGAPIPKGWEALLATCLAKEREDRPASAAAVLELIESLPDNETRRRTASTKNLASAVTTVLKGSAERRSLLLHPLVIIGAILALCALAVQLLVLKPRNDALAGMRAAREKLDAADTAARPNQAGERLAAWEQFTSTYGLKPIPFTEEDEAILNYAGERSEHYQAEVTKLAEEEARRQQLQAITTTRLAKALAAQRLADAAAPADIPGRLQAWSSLAKELAAAGHSDSKGYLAMLAEAEAAETQWRQKEAEAKKQTLEDNKRQAAEMSLAEQKASRWMQDFNSTWAVIAAKCADPDVSSAAKVQEVSAFLPTLVEPPAGAEKRAAELLALANAARDKALQATAMETPAAPLKPLALLADSPVKDQPEPVRRAFIMTMQEKLRDAGHYKGKPDGDHGPGSHAALVAYQKAGNLVASARLDPATLKALGMDQPDLAALADKAKKLDAAESTGSRPRRSSQPKEQEEPPGFWRKFGNGFRDAVTGPKK